MPAGFDSIGSSREDLHSLQWSGAAACQSLWSRNFSQAVNEEPGQMVLPLASDL